MRLWRNQVDASDLKSDVRKGVPVRFRSVVPAGIRIMDNTGDFYSLDSSSILLRRTTTMPARLGSQRGLISLLAPD